MTAVKRSYDNVEKSEEDKRLYRGLELNNGIKVRVSIFPNLNKTKIFSPGIIDF